jgi:hypothetical protein
MAGNGSLNDAMITQFLLIAMIMLASVGAVLLRTRMRRDASTVANLRATLDLLAQDMRLMTQMGGAVQVESRLGAGSVFRFDIRLRARRASDLGRSGQSAAEPAKKRAAPDIAAPRHILVAEDNTTNRLVVTRMLERQGHSVVALVQRENVDLVLMDVMMPELDGLSATAQIRALPGSQSRLPIRRWIPSSPAAPKRLASCSSWWSSVRPWRKGSTRCAHGGAQRRGRSVRGVVHAVSPADRSRITRASAVAAAAAAVSMAAA